MWITKGSSSALFCAGDGPSGLLMGREFLYESSSAAEDRVS